VGQYAAAEESAAAPPQTATAPSIADTGQAAAGTQPAQPTPEAEALALELQAQAPESAPGDDQVAATAGVQEGDQLAAPEPAQVPGGVAPSAGQLSEAAPFRTLNRIAGSGLAFLLAEIGLGGAALVLAVLTLQSRRRR
jgi:hypothetical protein